MARALHLFQFLLDTDNTIHQHPAVKFDLAFARTAKKPATAALAFKVGPSAYQPAALKGQRCQLNLQTARMRMCPRAKNFQNQGSAVDHLAFHACFKVALLHRCQRGVDHDNRVIMLFGSGRNPVDITGAKKGWCARLVKADTFGMHHLKADRTDKLHCLGQHGVGSTRQGHAANIRMNDECRRCAQYGLFSEV